MFSVYENIFTTKIKRITINSVAENSWGWPMGEY